MARAKRRVWTRAMLDEMLAWKASNGATDKQVADHFGVHIKTYQTAKFRMRSRGAVPGVDVQKSTKRPYKKGPKFIDINVPSPAPGKIAVIVCSVDQLKSTLLGLS